ncbi:MAG: glycosyltransferase family 4 protein [Acidobacteria bacterium]|nr:glycosyltransferase family 4 protein [Acidobacteriota bacterium]
MRLRIGIVTEYCYPLLGGISENVHHTARELDARGHRVTIITSTPTVVATSQLRLPESPRTIRIGRAISLKGNGARASATVGAVRLWNDLRAALNSERFDILLLHSPLNFTLPALAALQGPWPRMGIFHSYFERSVVYALFRTVLQRQFLRRLQGIIVVSRSVQLALSRYFSFTARVIPNGIDTDEFSPDVPRLEKFDESKRTLLFLGRFDPRNGLPFMLRAFIRLRRMRDDVRLIVVGSGGDERAYASLIPPALQSDVHFEGPALLERPRYYASADVFCSPVSRASFGITLLEAMASGKPIVATDNIGYRELLGPEEGVLVPYAEERFAAAIAEVLADDRRRREIGLAGRLKAMQYAWPVVVTSLLAFVDEILSLV